jgi:hypothetical protein
LLWPDAPTARESLEESAKRGRTECSKCKLIYAETAALPSKNTQETENIASPLRILKVTVVGTSKHNAFDEVLSFSRTVSGNIFLLQAVFID